MKNEEPAMETRAFIDAIEDDAARLVVRSADEVESFDVPRWLLPDDAVEGSWVIIGVRVIPAPPSDTEARRHTLGKNDPGGDIEL
jgi:hypothetical protein